MQSHFEIWRIYNTYCALLHNMFISQGNGAMLRLCLRLISSETTERIWLQVFPDNASRMLVASAAEVQFARWKRHSVSLVVHTRFTARSLIAICKF